STRVAHDDNERVFPQRKLPRRLNQARKGRVLFFECGQLERSEAGPVVTFETPGRGASARPDVGQCDSAAARVYRAGVVLRLQLGSIGFRNVPRWVSTTGVNQYQPLRLAHTLYVTLEPSFRSFERRVSWLISHR